MIGEDRKLFLELLVILGWARRKWTMSKNHMLTAEYNTVEYIVKFN